MSDQPVLDEYARWSASLGWTDDFGTPLVDIFGEPYAPHFEKGKVYRIRVVCNEVDDLFKFMSDKFTHVVGWVTGKEMQYVVDIIYPKE